VVAGARFVAILDRTTGTLFGPLLPDRLTTTELRWFNLVDCCSYPVT